MGILGLGRIGEAIAHRAAAFGISVAYHNRHRKDVAYDYYPTLVELAAASDILMIVIPGGAETGHLVNAEVLAALGPDGILINVARGTVVDESALVDALRIPHDPDRRPGRLRARAQGPPRPAHDVDNAVLLPHVGSGDHPHPRRHGPPGRRKPRSWLTNGVPVTPVQESEGLIGSA